MSDDQLPETPPPATTPPAALAQQPAANPLELPEVKAAIAAAAEHARNATWKQARETVKSKSNGTAPSTEPPPAPQPAAPAANDVTAILALRDAFDDVVGDMPIKSSQRSLVREAVMRDRPPIVAEYVARFAERAGWSAPTTPTAPTSTPSAAPSAPAAPAAHPVTASAAPSSPVTVTDDVPLIQRSEADRQAFLKTHGIVAYTNRMRDEVRNNGARIRLR